jgi:hypothetical protein
MNAGTIGRAQSAVPLSHALDPAADETVQHFVQQYRRHGKVSVFRLLDTGIGLHGALQKRGFKAHEPTWVQVAKVADMASLGRLGAPTWQVMVNRQPDAAWRYAYRKVATG